MPELLSFRKDRPAPTSSSSGVSGAPSTFKPSFDSDGRLRVLEPERFTQTEELERESRAFMAGALRSRARVRPHFSQPAV